MDRLANHFRLLDKLLGGKSKIPVGVSSCLVGDKVRYDGDHKHSVFITDTLGQYLQFNKFCPELEIGLGVPRKPIRLTKNKQGLIRCVQIGNGSIDVTDSLQDLADQQASWHQQLCGYIFKKGSPSCGLGNVKIWDKEVFEKYEEYGLEVWTDSKAILVDSATEKRFKERIRNEKL